VEIIVGMLLLLFFYNKKNVQQFEASFKKEYRFFVILLVMATIMQIK